MLLLLYQGSLSLSLLLLVVVLVVVTGVGCWCWVDVSACRPCLPLYSRPEPLSGTPSTLHTDGTAVKTEESPVRESVGPVLRSAREFPAHKLFLVCHASAAGLSPMLLEWGSNTPVLMPTQQRSTPDTTKNACSLLFQSHECCPSVSDVLLMECKTTRFDASKPHI